MSKISFLKIPFLQRVTSVSKCLKLYIYTVKNPLIRPHLCFGFFSSEKCTYQCDRFRNLLIHNCSSYAKIFEHNCPMATLAEKLEVSPKEIRLSPQQTTDAVNDIYLNYFSDYKDVLKSSVDQLLKGSVIAVPTDTIYGVAGLAQQTTAVERIYEIKKRAPKKPIAISVATIDDIYKWSHVTVSRSLLTDLLPGPVTVVFERNPELNMALNPATRLVGVRIPEHKFMQDLARECDQPIALTSANISGASSCLHVQEFHELWPALDLIVNGGTLHDTEESRQGSTVVDLSQPGQYKIIRPGSAYQTTVNCLHRHSLQESTS